MKTYNFFRLLAFLVLIPLLDFAQQAGDLDRTFSYGRGPDYQFNAGNGPNRTIYNPIVQPDGKTIVFGSFSSFYGYSRNGIARLNADGSLDVGFNPGEGANGVIQSSTTQTNGKIIITGGFTTLQGTPRNRIVRLNANGTIDATFNIGNGANAYVSGSILQEDGRIIIWGPFTTYNGTARNHIARLNANGSLDASFNSGTSDNGYISNLTLQSDGKIIVTGSFSAFNGTSRNNIARINADGSVDLSFNPGTGAIGIDGRTPVETSTLQTDGKIIILGNFATYNGVTRNKIARLNADGSLDAGFNVVLNETERATSLLLQPNGKIVVATFVYHNWANIRRLNANGTLDNSFIGGEMRSVFGNVSVNSISQQPDGKIVIGGEFTSYKIKINNVYISPVGGDYRNRIARINADGSLDESFNNAVGIGNESEILVSTLQSDGKILIGGRFTGYNSINCNRIARLNADGGLDPNFNIGTGASDVVRAIAMQNDGKILIAGNFVLFNGINRNRIARLNANGTLDASFNPGSGANNIVRNIQIQPDGKIIIGGDFSTYNRVSRNGIARLNADGSLDASFNPGTNYRGGGIALQPDGKIVAYVGIINQHGTTINRIGRFNTDGSLDASVNIETGIGTNDMNYSQNISIVLQPNAKIIVGGEFRSYNGITKSNLIRLNSDCSLDTNFNVGNGIDYIVRSINLQPDNKIILGGLFSTYQGSTSKRLQRLNPDGSLDIGFNQETVLNEFINTTILQPDGKIILAGKFSGYNNISTPGIARIHGGGCTAPNIPSPPTISGINSFCTGSSTVLTSSAVNGNLWSNGDFAQSITVTEAGIYTVRQILNGCTSAISNPVLVNISDCGPVFIGTGSNNTSSNWANNSVPANGTNINIAGNMMVNANVSYNNVFVQTGGIITVNQGNTLTITGNLNISNLGRIVGDGYVRLAGSNNQEFGGGAINNLVLNNNATVIQTAATQIGSSLILGNNQVLNLNNQPLTLLSTATHTAQLAEVPAGSSIINANNFTVQRWINNTLVRRGNTSEGNYYFLGPVVQGQTMNLWNSVSPYNNQTFSGIGVGNLYLYNPAVNNWYKPSSATTPLSVGAGVQVWFGASTFFGSRSTWSVTGTPQVGDYNLTITPTLGFHLVSNPYPSTIDWDSPNWTKTNVANAIYVYDWVNRRYKSYIDGLGTNGGNRYLPTAQGFMVYAESNAPILTARESIKVSNQVALQRTESAVSSIIRLQTRRGSMTDEVVIAHRPNTQLAFEPEVDAQKMLNPATNIFVGGAVRQSIASMDLNAATVIPIELLSDSTGMVTVSTEEFSGLSGGTYYLVDEITTEVYPYTPQSTYQFFLNANEPYSLSLRMNNVTGINISKASQFEVFPNPATNKVTINTKGSGTLEIVNTIGQVMITQLATETNEINVSKLAKGVYTVRFNGTSKLLLVK